MGNFRPLPTACWIALLTMLGYTEKRISSSHHQWTKPGKRTIPVWGNEKEIPAMHMKTCGRGMGWSLNDIYAWAGKNC